MMTIDTASDTMRLAQLLTEALALADVLDMPIAAIHIDEALSHLSANPLVDLIQSEIVPTALI